jgi:paraquat-inducible protein A
MRASRFEGLRNSYAFRHPLAGLVINTLLLAALLLLVAGLYLPILTLEKFWFFSNTVSLLSALQQLAQQAEWGLFALLGVFSVLFPVIKLVLLFLIWNFEPATTPVHSRHLRWLAACSKWSMLDVFVVALLVVSVKLGALADARVEMGIYAFAASVLLSMVVAGWVGRYAED